MKVEEEKSFEINKWYFLKYFLGGSLLYEMIAHEKERYSEYAFSIV